MTRIAGVDIGNSTTEVVIVEDGRPLAWRRRPTRGSKGSGGSIRAAASLLRAIESEQGIKADRVVVAPWHPVATRTLCLSEPPPDTGRLAVIDCQGQSISGNAAVAGIPWDVRTPPPPAEAAIAIVPPKVGYRQAAARVREARGLGCDVVGVAAALDEAVLITARLDADIPVVDGIDTVAALGCRRLLLEVRPPGHRVATATDVWALSAMLATDDGDRDALPRVARWVRDARAVVIGVCERPPAKAEPVAAITVTWAAGGHCELFDAVERLRRLPVGAVVACGAEGDAAIRDLWAVDITTAVAAHGIGSAERGRDVVVASLAEVAAGADHDLQAIFGIPVEVAGSEAAAAAAGARTTPGLDGDALVLDIGGGTIDLIGSDGITAAGAGELLTVAVARLLDVPRGAADWIKRGPARRVESPGVLLDENGSRQFCDDAANRVRAVGTLVAPGPGGAMSFGGGLQPAEWRIMRQSLKQEVIAANIGRVLESRGVGGVPRPVVIVGGPAGDDELLPSIGRLKGVAAFGRGNVAGVLGHRYAVAYGLTLLASQ